VRPRLVWSAFAACVIVAAAALAWSTRAVLRLEADERAARRQAVVEENARLALWRMDSWLTPLLAQEGARPYFHYRTFYPAVGAWSQMFVEPRPGEPLVPSPLLREPSPYVLLHFQLAPGGELSSPQAPVGPFVTLAVSDGHATPALVARGALRLRELRATSTMTATLRTVAQEGSGPAAKPPVMATLPAPAPAKTSFEEQLKNTREYVARQQNLQLQQAAAPAPPPGARVTAPELEGGTMTPVWSGDSLLLVRRVRVNGAVYVQGCWLDWPSVQRELVASVRDLLPQARLERVGEVRPGDDARRLAALPVQLIPGAVPLPPAPGSPVRISLIAAWGAVLLAAISVAVLLRGVMDLSERRRVFVSAVTHELRTPLTTFRLYTDMLADGMVSGEEKRRSYLERLRGEAQRLGHLVENVLFYARLESGRAGAVRETVDLREVVTDTVSRLEPRAAAAGLQIEIEDSGPQALPAFIDRSALEQILVNLVDNACKYAAASTPPVIGIRLDHAGHRALVHVRDHGPGLSKPDRKRLFRPFSKSDRDAASSAPGVGLGLALSQRLARAQGGDLRLEQPADGGAAFVISLPLTS
jgi:signal transduction histidine kinase